MTHFYTIVLVPSTEDNIKRFITEKLYRYDENLDVTPHLADCVCLGSKARDDANDAADVALRTIEDKAEEFRKIDKVSDAAQSIGYRKYLMERKKYMDDHISKNADRNEPDPGCPHCLGIGRSPSTYNPDSKFDYYVLGGRFAKCIQGEHDGDPHETENLSDNIMQVRDIDTGTHLFPTVIVMPDGTWIEKGTVGLFGHIQDEMPDPEWEETVGNIYKKHSGHMAVGLDCHV